MQTDAEIAGLYEIARPFPSTCTLILISFTLERMRGGIRQLSGGKKQSTYLSCGAIPPTACVLVLNVEARQIL
jgi:hypothetical protein